MLTEPERIATFESVLRERFGLDPESCREGEDWWRFVVDDVKFQGGVHSADVRVSALLCKTAEDADVDAIHGDLRGAAAAGLAKFEEADCYLYASARASFADVDAERIERMIRDCAAAAKSPAGDRLKGKWRDW